MSFYLPSLAGFLVVSADDDEMARVNEGRQVSSKSPFLVNAGDVGRSKETDETRFKLSKCREEFPSSSPVLANEGLFELTRRHLLTRAISSSSAETTEDPAVVR